MAETLSPERAPCWLMDNSIFYSSEYVGLGWGTFLWFSISYSQVPLLNFPRELHIWEFINSNTRRSIQRLAFVVWGYELCPKDQIWPNSSLMLSVEKANPVLSDILIFQEYLEILNLVCSLQMQNLSFKCWSTVKEHFAGQTRHSCGPYRTSGTSLQLLTCTLKTVQSLVSRLCN